MKRSLFPALQLLLQLVFPMFLGAQPIVLLISPEIDSLIQISRDHTAEAEFSAAFEASAAAGALAVACCGEQSVAYAAYCFNEGRIRYFMSRNEEAIPWYIRAKELRRELLGTTHPEYGKSLNNLAIVYDVLGQYEAAEPLYREALQIRAEVYGTESWPYLSVLGNLATLFNTKGDFEQAELLSVEVMRGSKSLLGEDSPEYARSLVNLATLYYETNNFLRAQQYYLEAKTIYEAQEELDFYEYVTLIDNLGAVYMLQGDFEKAEQYYQEVADLRLAILGEKTADYALSLSHLAAVYSYTDRIKEAEDTLLAALEILAEMGQEDAIDYGYFLQNLGDVYLRQGNFEDALNTQQASFEILAARLQVHHPRYLRGLRNLARVYLTLGQDEAAAEQLIQLAKLEEKPLRSAVRHLSEDELANFTIDFKDHLDQYFTLVETYPSIAEVCYDKILTYKGFLQSKVHQLQQLANKDPLIEELYQELRGVHRQLAASYSASSTDAEALMKLENEAYQIEKEMVRQSTKLAEVTRVVDWRFIQAQLTPGTAAIEFVDYDNHRRNTEDLGRYGALLILPQAPQPIFIPLCTASALDSLFFKDTQGNEDYINSFYSSIGQGDKLYELLWAPIEEELQVEPTINKVFYAPAGLLHRINLSAIPQAKGRTLGQKYQFLTLGSTRQLTTKRTNVPPDTSKVAVLYGAIDYSSSVQTLAEPDSEAKPGSQALNAYGYSSQRGFITENPYWKELPWTEVEILTAEELLVEAGYQSIIKTKADATEASLKALDDDQPLHVLHLATHGFFFPDPEEIAGEDALAFRASEHSMIRSGLVLAGANYAWTHGKARESAGEDGILTAYEVSKMDLSTTDLVVLSACETGLGDIKGIEGVYGLQRAFKIAGARYLIMTLWQVPDFQAQAFMTTFYLAWLEEGKSIPEAFHTAQTYMRARYKNAFEWAGFILVE